jgi:hypothetical protein
MVPMCALNLGWTYEQPGSTLIAGLVCELGFLRNAAHDAAVSRHHLGGLHCRKTTSADELLLADNVSEAGLTHLATAGCGISSRSAAGPVQRNNKRGWWGRDHVPRRMRQGSLMFCVHTRTRQGSVTNCRWGVCDAPSGDVNAVSPSANACRRSHCVPHQRHRLEYRDTS